MSNGIQINNQFYSFDELKTKKLRRELFDDPDNWSGSDAEPIGWYRFESMLIPGFGGIIRRCLKKESDEFDKRIHGHGDTHWIRENRYFFFTESNYGIAYQSEYGITELMDKFEKWFKEMKANESV